MNDSETFPFNTCEKPKPSGLAQPYSFAINMVSIIIIIYFIFKATNTYTKITFLSLLLFQSSHTFSHGFHIGNRELQLITHITAIILASSLFYMFYNITGTLPGNTIIIILLTILAGDIYLTIKKAPFIYTFLTQISIFIITILAYYGSFTSHIQNSIKIIIPLTILISLLVINETINCNHMLSKYPNFPFHIFVETTGIIILITILKTFYKE
jgi:hypothetical protein